MRISNINHSKDGTERNEIKIDSVESRKLVFFSCSGTEKKSHVLSARFSFSRVLIEHDIVICVHSNECPGAKIKIYFPSLNIWQMIWMAT